MPTTSSGPIGILRQGVGIVRSLAEPFHNAELVSAGERRILIPTVYREDYLTALRVLTRQDHAAPLLAMLEFAQRYTAAIDFATYEGAVRTLGAIQAFEEPRPDVRLRLPSGTGGPASV